MDQFLTMAFAQLTYRESLRDIEVYRFQADQDLVLVSNCRASRLDPTSRNGIGSKLGFDATKPLAADSSTFKRIRVPGKEELDLATVLQSRASSEWRESLSGYGYFEDAATVTP
jgi:3-polyprenyl-4-hydroxybenzoate decarboxylase